MSRNVTLLFHNKRQIKTRELNEENNINKGIGIARLVVGIALIIYGFNASDSVNRRAGDCPLGQRGIESFQGTVSGGNAVSLSVKSAGWRQPDKSSDERHDSQ